MKDKQGKHDHKLTKLLKFGLFATLMVAPLFAVLFKCMYVTFNKNAYQSYYSETINEVTYTPLDSVNDIKVNETYNLNIPQNSTYNTSASGTFYVSNVKKVSTNYSTSLTGDNITSFYIAYNQSLDANVFTIFQTTNQTLYINLKTNYITFDFTLDSYNTLSQWDYYFDKLNTISYNPSSYLDNAFYYSIDQMQENSLFNWTTSTAIYTPIQAMTTGLGITTDAVAILLTYWLYLTLIYIVIDIVVELFTWMTHTLLGKPLG